MSPAPPTSVSTNARCSAGGSGPSGIAAKRRSPRKPSRTRVRGWRRSTSPRAVAAEHEGRGRPEAAHDVLQRLQRDLGRVQVLHVRTRGLPPRSASACGRAARRPASGSRPRRAAARGCAPPLAASRISTISVSIGKRARRSGARSEKSAGGGASRVPGSGSTPGWLAEALVGEGAVPLDRAAVQHPDAARPGEALDLVEEARLADPGLARHDHELALARHRRVQPLLQLRELARSRPTSGAWATRGACIDCVSPPPPARGRSPEARAVALQRLRHLARPAAAGAPAPSAGREDDRLQLLVDLRPRLPRGLGELVHDAVEDRLRLAANGGPPATHS